MGEQRKIATFVRDLSGFTGSAKLYHVSPPIEQKDWDGEVEAVHSHVVVSATVALFSGPETYIFPANEDGQVVDWGELDGSFQGDLDHEAALRGAGYEIGGEVLVVAESAPRKAIGGGE